MQVNRKCNSGLIRTPVGSHSWKSRGRTSGEAPPSDFMCIHLPHSLCISFICWPETDAQIVPGLPSIQSNYQERVGVFVPSIPNKKPRIKNVSRHFLPSPHVPMTGQINEKFHSLKPPRANP